MKVFFYFGKPIGIFLLILSGVGTVWYTHVGLSGSNVGHIFLIMSAVPFAVIAYLMYNKKVMAKSHLIVVIATILVLGVLCIILSPFLLHYTDDIHWLWLVEATYDPETGILFLLFAREVISLDKTSITAYAGFDAHNLGNATVIQDMNARTIILQVPDLLQDSLSSSTVISVGHGAIGAVNPHTIPNIMPPTIVITTPLK